MIKLISFLKEENILIPRRSSEEREKNYKISIQKKIQQYIKDGSKGDLDLSDTPITSLPDNLKVGGYLDLSGTPITSLPDNLKVGGNLDLSGTKITSLPDNLEVGGYLDLSGTKITSLPDNLEVGGYLDLRDTPISKKYTNEEIKNIIIQQGGDIKGDIYIK